MGRNIPKSETGSVLWQVTFALFPDTKVSRKAEIAFEKNITRYLWAIEQTGSLINRDCPELLSLQFTIDLEDRNTVNSVNLLPTVFARRLNPDQRRSFRIKIFENEVGGYKDSIVMDSGGLFVLEGIASSFLEFANSLPSLIADIKNVQC